MPSVDHGNAGEQTKAESVPGCSLVVRALEIVVNHLDVRMQIKMLEAETESLRRALDDDGAQGTTALDAPSTTFDVFAGLIVRGQKLESELEDLQRRLRCDCCGEVNPKTKHLQADINVDGRTIRRICVDCREENDVQYCDGCQQLVDADDDDDDDDNEVERVYGCISDYVTVERRRCYLLCRECRDDNYVKFCEACEKYSDFNVEYVEDGLEIDGNTVYDVCRDCQQKNGLSFCEGCDRYRKNVIWWSKEDIADTGYQGLSACPECRDTHNLRHLAYLGDSSPSCVVM